MTNRFFLNYGTSVRYLLVDDSLWLKNLSAFFIEKRPDFMWKLNKYIYSLDAQQREREFQFRLAYDVISQDLPVISWVCPLSAWCVPITFNAPAKVTFDNLSSLRLWPFHLCTLNQHSMTFLPLSPGWPFGTKFHSKVPLSAHTL